ncbi:unnamed protein product [Amoebophrya sp. A25]|nr:unnamed protein product [Amoebophrya sp. A25]|eukprot:GSA25T00016640001.1
MVVVAPSPEQEEVVGKASFCAAVQIAPAATEGHHFSSPKDIEMTNKVASSSGSVEVDPAAADKAKAEDAKYKAELAKISLSDLFQFADSTDKFCYWVGGINAVAFGLAQPAIAYVFGELFDTANMTDKDKFVDQMNDLLIWFGLIGIVSWITAWLFVWLYDVAGSRQTCKYRDVYFSAVVGQDCGWFDEKDIMTVPSSVQTDVRKIKDALGKNFALALQNGAQFLGGFVFSFFINWQLSLVLSAGLPFMGASAYYFSLALMEIASGTNRYYVKAGGVADEVFGAVKTVISFGAEQAELDRYSIHLESARLGKVKSGTRIGMQVGSLWSCCFLLYALAFWYGSILVGDKIENQRTGEAFTGGDVMKCFFCILLGMFGIGQVAPWIQAVAEAKPALLNLKRILNEEKPKVTEGKVELSSATLSGSKGVEIAARDITFSYPTRKDMQVLRGISFDIKGGQKVAFVGESGCGKSTLIQLLERFYDVDGGSLSFNGHNIKDLSFNSLGSLTGYVSQEPVLFNYTIRENLCFGLRDRPSDEQLKDALKQAQVWDVISGLPQGLDTLPGTAGSQFSGGQKQRIAIARALVRKPKLLLLDEATSALDYTSEKLVQETIDKLTSNAELTVIVVAHRLSTVRNCDQILFFEKGVIAERGTHAELLAMQGGYYRLTQTQEALALAGSVSLSRGNTKESVSPQSDVAPGDRQLSGKSASPVNAVGSPVEPGKTEGVEGGTPTQEAVLARAPSKDPMTQAGSNALDLVKTEDEKEEERMAKIEKEYSVPMSRLLTLNTPAEKLYYPLGFFFSLCNGSYQPLCAYILTAAMEDFYIQDPEEMKEELMKSVLGFVAIGVASFFTYTAACACYSYAGSHLTMRARKLIFVTYMKQEMAYFDDPANTPGKLTAALENKAADLSYITGEQMGVKVETVSALVCGVTFAFIASWKVAAVVTACLPPLVIAMIILFVVLMGQGSGGESPEVVASGGIIAEVILNLKTVRAMRAERDFLKTYLQAVETIKNKEVKSALPAGFGFGFSNGIIFGVYVVGFWYGAKLIKEEGLSATDMFRAVMCIIFAGMGAGQAGAAMPSVAKAKTAAHDIFELADRVPQIDSTIEGNAQKQTIDRMDAIDFRAVEFAYPSRPTVPILKGLDLSDTLKLGQSVALAGPSGSGKSTIMALLQRYYDPEKGKIVLNNGPELQEINLNKWRQVIGYVGQEPILFNVSAMDNILYGIPPEERAKFSEADVQSVAMQANVNFIGGSDGKLSWTEPLGPRGSKISGGQKQRIAIARALIRKPQILMLDEATSALDAVSEAEVQETLDKLQTDHPDRLTITIAHRLSTIQNCDKIVVMCDGVLLEQGSHSELLEKEGLYKKLIQSQGAGPRGSRKSA